MENSDNDNESISSTSTVIVRRDGTRGSRKMKVPLLPREGVSTEENVRNTDSQCDAIRGNAVEPREGRLTRSMTAKTAGSSVPKAVVKTKMTEKVIPKRIVFVSTSGPAAGARKPFKMPEGYRKPGPKDPPEERI